MALSGVKLINLNAYKNLGYNVILEGEHGVGKTAIIKEVFKGMAWKYFSASTLDPWVDFVGVPKTTQRADGSNVLELIRPQFIQDDQVEAIFFDELNRAPDKVLNAVMELIQFKSINGHKLNNLKIVWAAINPSDEEDTYAVNRLDPAHLDRFHVNIRVPYECDLEYFITKYPDIGQIFVNWWNDIDGVVKKKVSPRRLDYACDAYKNGCRLEDFLPYESNIKKLRTELQKTPIITEMMKITTQQEANDFLKDNNNSIKVMSLTNQGNKVAEDFIKKFGGGLSKEVKVSLGESLKNNPDGGSKYDCSSFMVMALNFTNAKSDLTKDRSLMGFDVKSAYNEDHIIGSMMNDYIAYKASEPEVTKELSTYVKNFFKFKLSKTLADHVGEDKETTHNYLMQMFCKLHEVSDVERTIINKKLYDAKLTTRMEYF